jgi:hypothetical protein
MPDFAHSATVARTKLFDKVQVFRSKVEVILDADLQLSCLVVAFIPVHGSKVRSLGGRWRLRGESRCQGKALDILPLHRAGSERVGHDGLSAGDGLGCWWW